MSDRYRMYATDREPGKTVDGAVLEWSKGCNGVQHVDTLAKVYRRRGEVVDAELITDAVVIRGECDDSCGDRKIGEFSFP